MRKTLRSKHLMGIFAALVFACLLLPANSLFGQGKMSEAEMLRTPAPDQDAAPGQILHQNHQRPLAMWDVEFVNNVEQATGIGGWAGCIYLPVQQEWWTAVWNTDTLARFNSAGTLIGTFVIPGVSGIRGMTSDPAGTTVYAGNASTTIYVIDPSTRTSTGTITSPEAARHITYDPTANGGMGGLWVGNWATDIYQISLTGNTLATVSAASHGLTAMYGSAWDGWSAGGPYLWVFDQSGTSSDAELVQLSLPSGTPTGLRWDAMRDVGASSIDGLAGGMHITSTAVPGKTLLCGVLQGTPDNLLFGYEMDSLGVTVDAQLNNSGALGGYTQIPSPQATSISFTGIVANNGTDQLGTLNYNVDVQSGGSSVFMDTQSASNVASGNTVTLTSATFSPSGVGTYDVLTYTSVGSPQVDSINSNDTLGFSFMISDSTFARDNGIHDGGTGYAASNTDWAYVCALYELSTLDSLTSVTIEIETPVQGDTTYAVVADASGGVAGAIIATGPPVIINAGQNTYVLPLPGGVELAPGSYAIGCYEGANTTINLRQSNNIFTPDMNFFYLANQGWFFSSIPTARFIRPNFGTPMGVGIDEAELAQGMQVYPNPTDGRLMLSFELGEVTDMEISVTDMMGRSLYQNIVRIPGQELLQLDLTGQAPGVYFVTASNGKVSHTHKVVLR